MRGRRRPRKRPLSEINVTPLVDVMLVLLIIFMISAPLLTVGVPVDLPKTDASAIETDDTPLNVSVDREGRIFVDQTPATYEDFTVQIQELAGGNGAERPVYVRADGQAAYETVARVMARLQVSGFTKINLVTDTAPAEERAG